jgi:hypothetical protein
VGGGEGEVVVEGPAVIVVDLFSGRPNPRFALDADTAAAVAALVATLPEAREHRIPDVGLGFRGYRVELATAVLRVFGTLVADEATAVVRLDEDRAVERRLTRWVLEHGDPALARALPPP